VMDGAKAAKDQAEAIATGSTLIHSCKVIRCRRRTAGQGMSYLRLADPRSGLTINPTQLSPSAN
jgi:hypothetical protein